jgi:type I restriction enzyme M protein
MTHPSKRITQQELESYLWGAAVLLRGLIDAGDYKQFIFPLLFYKRVSDVWDEEYQAALANSGGDLSYAQFAENHRFQIPEGAHWKDVRQTPKNVGAAIQKAMRAIETANPDLLDGIFGDASWTNRERLPDETLKNLIEHFSTQTLSVVNVPEDELGNAYEYLIKKFADDSGHTAAEFYTNRTVVHLMTATAWRRRLASRFYDPTCGTGGHADLGAGRGEALRRRVPHAQALRAGAQPHHLVHRPHEPVPARRRRLRNHPGRHPGRSQAHRRRPPAPVRCDPGQPAVLHQAVEPRGMEQ